jgi:CTP:phosphocholine cytidylyltransferase-like protein
MTKSHSKVAIAMEKNKETTIETQIDAIKDIQIKELEVQIRKLRHEVDYQLAVIEELQKVTKTLALELEDD